MIARRRLGRVLARIGQTFLDHPVSVAPDRLRHAARILQTIGQRHPHGMRVTLSDGLQDPSGVPETVGRNAYRVIQEGLTNAGKHAPQTPVEISLSGSPGDHLKLEVRNPLRVGTNGSRPPTSGLGLVGLAERAALSGGRLEHETTADRYFVLRAWLPWPA